MKQRFLLFITLLVIGFGATVFQEITTNFQKQETIKANSEAIPRDINGIAQSLEMLNKNITTILLSLGKIVLIFLILIVIQRILFLIWSRSSQLVIDNFSNASGNEELDRVLAGLSQLARERLVREMKGVHHRLKEHVVPRTYRPADKLPLPRATPDQRLTNLVDSLNKFTPEQIDPVVQLLNVVFPVYGTKVTSTLQSQGNDDEKIGITFEITDIEGGHLASKAYTKLYTVWELPQDREKDEEQDLEIDSTLSPSLKERYRLLLKPATRWLAIELSRREMVAAVPRFYFGKKRTHYQAQIHNFFGVLYHASALTHGLFFYKLAIEDFQQAIKLCPNWYQLHENLAYTYSSKGRQLQNSEGQNSEEQNSEAIDLQRQAIVEYENAFNKCTNKEAIPRIRVGKAKSQLLAGDQTQIQEAKDEIEYLEKNWDATFEMNARFIYNMAGWYAIVFAQGHGNERIKKIAQNYLVYALVRNTERDLWSWAGKDPDFQAIRENFTELQFVVLKKLNRLSQLPNLKGEEFAQIIEEILKESKWF